MSDNPYSKYAYKRKRKRRSVYPLVVTAALAVIILFSSNFLFGFINFGGGGSSGSVTLRSVDAWAVQSESFATKSDALEYALEVKRNGGAGLVMESGAAWVVFENTYLTKADAEREKAQFQVRGFSVAERKIKLDNKAHRKVFATVADSFIDNFELFNDYLNKFRTGAVAAAEVSNAALQNYNSLQIAVKQLDEIQEGVSDTFFAKVLFAANKQLLALYLLSGSALNTSFESDIAACICNIIFAYSELSSN